MLDLDHLRHKKDQHLDDDDVHGLHPLRKGFGWQNLFKRFNQQQFRC